MVVLNFALVFFFESCQKCFEIVISLRPKQKRYWIDLTHAIIHIKINESEQQPKYVYVVIKIENEFTIIFCSWNYIDQRLWKSLAWFMCIIALICNSNNKTTKSIIGRVIWCLLTKVINLAFPCKLKLMGSLQHDIYVRNFLSNI